MIATLATHSTTFASKAMPFLLERTKSLPRNVSGNSKKRDDSKKIVPLEEIVYIEGTISVAF